MSADVKRAAGQRPAARFWDRLETTTSSPCDDPLEKAGRRWRLSPTSPNPNVFLDAPLSLAHPAGSVLGGGIFQQGVGFEPNYDTEGKFEALEFAAGNYGLLESAYEYAKDRKPPDVKMVVKSSTSSSIDVTFEYVNEPSVIRYTTDGTKPDATSALWDSTGPREPGEVFRVTSNTTFRWMATDIKGNFSFGVKIFRVT